MILGALAFSAAYFGYKALSLSTFFAKGLLIPGITANKRYKKGSWAAITGSSDGIGAEYAVYLAQQGFNIVLMGRSSSKLDKVEGRLAEFKVQVKKIVVDLEGPKDLDWYSEFWNSNFSGLDISIFINNAGVMNFGGFMDIPVRYQKQMVDVNITALVMFSNSFLKYVKAQEDKTRRYALINVSSVAGEGPIAYNAAYAATKAFVTRFTQGIAVEAGREIPNLDI